jgi:nucleoside-diphosphate-sugar epimerase
VYGGAGGHNPLREDLPLSMTAGHVIPAFKKIGELLSDHLADATGLEIYSFRIAAAWGPLGRSPSPFFAAPQLVHAAARGTAPDFSPPSSPAYADDGLDMCYVKDCGRAIALLQLAEQLRYRTYNVATGRATTNKELVATIKKLVPDAQIELPEGHDPNGRARTSISTSAGSARTPATSPPTTPNARWPTTSAGCAQATTASTARAARQPVIRHEITPTFPRSAGTSAPDAAPTGLSGRLAGMP